MVGAFVTLGGILLIVAIFVVYDGISYRRGQRARRR
jgi:hypothetical protein